MEIERVGRLTVFCGPMFAGKTEALIGATSNLRPGTYKVYKPTTDTRQEGGHILSHGGIGISAEWTDPGLECVEACAHILIDEAQFLTAPAVEKVMALVRKGCSVILAGLDLDAKTHPFGQMPEFLCLADEVVKLSGACSSCGRPSSRTHCKVPLEGTVLVGGAEKYEPKCKACYDSLR